MHQFIQDSHLVERGLRNYWGYNSIGFLAPHNDYSSSGQAGGQVQEFKQMVKALHAAGIEVILDVVYNHTAEGNHLGPTLSFKGIDNPAYYRLVDDDPRFYYDTTGTGNSLNMRHPHVLQLIMDSLRYWVTEMHVDGFRFDLASTLARQFHEVDRLSAFFDLIQQDPVVSRVKLIAEPWDVGEGGYQVGNFPPLWSEWNGKYRDTLRDFWRGEDQTLGEFASRITGSSDLYQDDGRHPYASINFVTAHDGFTLADLTAYNDKHNDANGEGGADGESHNSSWNCGAEGPTDDPEVNELRGRQRRNFLATLLLSQGIPMLLGGDEIGRTQGGNNNAYCQDNEISWFDWEHIDGELLAFTQRVIAFRSAHPVFRRRRFPTPQGDGVVPARRRAHDRRGLGLRLRQGGRGGARRRRDHRDRRARRADRRRLLPARLQRPLRAAGLPHARRRRALAARAGHRGRVQRGRRARGRRAGDRRGPQRRRLPEDGLMDARDRRRARARPRRSSPCAASSTSSPRRSCASAS